MATRVMADSGPVAAPLIPSVAPKASIVAASPGWSQGTWAKLGSRGYTRLRYTHDPTDWSADILDVEPGYASAADVPGWLDRRRAAGLAPGTVYANVSRIASVKQAASGRPFYWWANDQAHPFPHGVPGAVAVQWFGSRQRSLWRGVDISLVTSGSWPPGGQSSWWRGVSPPAGPDPQAPPGPSWGGAAGQPLGGALSSSSMGTPNGLGSMFGGDTTSSSDVSAADATAGTDTSASAQSGGGLGGGWLWLLAAGGVVVAWLVIRDERKKRQR